MSHRVALLAAVAGLFAPCLVAPSLDACQAAEPIALFDGKGLDPWYVFLKDHGKDKDPNGNFSVRDGILRISGKDWGGIITKKEYANYRLEVEFAWSGKVWPPREKVARDCGLILHSTGPDGKVGGSWLEGIQCNMIEGGTGDISVTGANKAYSFRAETEERPWGNKKGRYWKSGAPLVQYPPGTRLLWFDRDPNWDNVINFRGKKDVEKPVGEWNQLAVTMAGNTMEVRLNGVTVSRAQDLTITRGKIQFQSEGAECLLRKVILHPLD